MNDDNIVPFGSFEGGKSDKDMFPSNPYIIEDIDGNVYGAEGYLIFTSQHVCIMENVGEGAIPSVMIPLSRLKVVELAEDDDGITIH